MLLERQGHAVKSVKTIRQCLEIAGRERFDLYMLDDDYADGTGIELCRQLRSLTPEVPVLFFSSAAFEHDRQRAMQAGARAYLTKPSDILEIVQTVNAILHSPAKGNVSNDSRGQ
jgi:DNA-binding response OmpR family regulator